MPTVIVNVMGTVSRESKHRLNYTWPVVSRIAEQAGVELEALPYLESLLLGTIDAALAAQNAVVAMESLGLGSVYIGGIRNDIEGVAKELGLPPQVYPVFGLCVGVLQR